MCSYLETGPVFQNKEREHFQMTSAQNRRDFCPDIKGQEDGRIGENEIILMADP